MRVIRINIGRRNFAEYTWQIVANLLESGDIFKVARCGICQNFFYRHREWQKYCPGACQETNKKRNLAKRQARHKRKSDGIVRERKRIAEQKTMLAQLRKMVVTPEFKKRLRDGPSQREKKAKEMLSFLQTVKSPDEFQKRYPAEYRVLDKLL
jgi:hypothetical protein